MWSMLSIFFFISLKAVIGSDHYWRDYDGNTPHDALVDRDTGLAIAQIYSKKYPGFHPTGSNGCCGEAEIKYDTETITEDIKVLCAENPERYYWEWVDAANVTTSSTQRGLLVKGGQTNNRAIFIAKIFIRGHWYIGEIEDSKCYFYNVANCYHTISQNGWCVTPDCMVLKYRNVIKSYFI